MITVEDLLMSKGPDVTVASQQDTVLQAARLMSDARVGCVVVRDEGELKGIFTERDLLSRVVARQKDPTTTVLADVMSNPIKACRLSDDILSCAKTMRDAHVRHLVVVEDGVLVGLIGLRDILAADMFMNSSGAFACGSFI